MAFSAASFAFYDIFQLFIDMIIDITAVITTTKSIAYFQGKLSILLNLCLIVKSYAAK